MGSVQHFGHYPTGYDHCDNRIPYDLESKVDYSLSFFENYRPIHPDNVFKDDLEEKLDGMGIFLLPSEHDFKRKKAVSVWKSRIRNCLPWARYWGFLMFRKSSCFILHYVPRAGHRARHGTRWTGKDIEHICWTISEVAPEWPGKSTEGSEG